MSPAMDMQELEKYTKYLFYKAAQIIVQSRQGDKIKTPSNPTPKQQSWFCLAINVSFPETRAQPCFVSG
jgi:hypothetical protein